MKQIAKWLFIVAVGTLFGSACSSNKAATSSNTPPVGDIPVTTFDTMVVTASPATNEPESYSLPDYNPSAARDWDLLHQKIDVSFDWQKQYVLGKTWLTLQPYFYSQNTLVLDAKGFDIHAVNLTSATGRALKYDYTDDRLYISLPKSISRKENVVVFIDYTAKPNEGEMGGSAAIQGDKGLYFIDPLDEDPSKPTQIWTQGETQSNSRWFPTIDKPNERCTEELIVTVDNKYVTLSNGVKTVGRPNGDGTRTDSYTMDKPHAPYLFALIVGEFDIVAEEWNNIPIEYYMEPEFKEYARNIFPHTPEMLSFFSKLLDYPFPWSKYSQVIVRDYVSGAMENTTAVIFGEFLNGTDRDLEDVLLNDKIVAHEMFHHWFGDLVTNESWANLTLQEGFANYSEYLWLEHKYGKDVADFHMMDELGGYLGSVAGGEIHPLIHYTYGNREEMFDAHSYNKGGCTLHMLRSIVGDEAFFASLNHYLRKNEYTDVEVDELRMAFEETIGMDMNWFFDQWYLEAGHPVIEVTQAYDATNGLSLTFEQTQDPDASVPIFQIPLKVNIYDANGKVRYEQVDINQRKQTVTFAGSEPALVIIDPDRVLVGELKFKKSPAALIKQYDWSNHVFYRMEALAKTQGMAADDREMLMTKALNDPFAKIRQMACEYYVQNELNATNRSRIEEIARHDDNVSAQAAALETLAENDNGKYTPLFKTIIADKSTPYKVLKGALAGLLTISPDDALVEANKLKDTHSPLLIGALGDIYARVPAKADLNFFKKNLTTIDGESSPGFYGDFLNIAFAQNDEAGLSAIQTVTNIGTDMNESLWRRFASVKSLADVRNNLSMKEPGSSDLTNAATKEAIDKAIEVIKKAETNPQLKQVYENF